MKFWKEHVGLRVSLIAAFFVLGMALIVAGWKMTGQLVGLGIMLAGVVFLLTSLLVYNKAFEEPKSK